MFDKNRILKHIDYGIVFSAFALILTGLMTISSATHAFSDGGSMKNLLMQIAFTVVSLIIAIFIISIDYNTIGGYYKIFYVCGVLGLLAVLLFGKTVNGAKAWLGVGPMGIQPAELFKVIMIIVVAKVLEEMDNINTIKNLGKIAGVVLLPMILIQLQPDTGTNLIFAVTIFGMIFYAGLDKRIIYTGFGTAVVGVLAVWFLDVLADYQKRRVLVFLNPELDMSGSGYNAHIAKTAIGAGQFFGSGLYGGAMTEGNFIPELHTDFIFSVFAEEWGFLGAMVLLALYFNIIWRGIKIARDSKDKFGTYIVVGVLSMLTFQILQNIGMDLGLMPITGIPLPFMSYGGSSLMTTIISLALVVNVGIRKKKINF
ncbi:rod shape-determining protein RodA [Clostridium cylindrosporum]|uniref:Stage V sporulation protein E n=1 Tax=Clostridium cylindrosporum DSM 605 TaxID=1121307 RepID=A0A0J8D622_CLOCY|nr:rod shape-determining protein RodA [Clostridium cylindrosporum]KMT21545.1 stage V sporulation protein E [Clostridium cylindrosporum DSM 605]